MANPAFGRSFSGKSTDNTALSSPVIASGTINAGEGVVVDISSTDSPSAQLPTILNVIDSAGNGYTKVDSQTSAAGFTLTEQWRSTSAAVASGATSVTVSYTVNSGANPVSLVVDVSAYTGVAAWGNKNKATGSGTAATVSVTTQDANNVVHAALGIDVSGTTPVASGGSTVRDSVTGISGIDVLCSGVDKSSASATSVAVSATVPSSDWSMVAIEMRSVAGGSAPSALPYGSARMGPSIGPRNQRGFLPQMAWAYPLFIAGAISITPDVGQLALTGFAPTVAVSNNQAVAPNVGALTLAGFAPTVATPVAVVPGVGALTLTGFVPSVVVNSVVNPGAGQVVLTGFAPTVATPVSVLPSVGQIVLTGFAPSVAIGTNVNPGTGQLTLTGFAPTVATPVSVLPGVGALSLTGFAPSVVVGINVRPNVGALTLTGFVPTVAVSNNQNVAAGLGQFTLTGFAPTVLASNRQTALPGLGQFTLTGFAPTITVAGGAIPRAIAQSDNTDTIVAGSSATGTLMQNSGTVTIISSDSKTIQIITGVSGVVSLDSDG